MSEPKPDYIVSPEESAEAMDMLGKGYGHELLAEVGWSDDEYPLPDEIRQAADKISQWLKTESSLTFCTVYFDGKIECGKQAFISAPEDSAIELGRPSGKQGYVYLLYSPDTGLYKIGKSKNVPQRKLSIAKQSPVPVDLVHYVKSINADIAEALLHKRHESKRVRGEWFGLLPEEVEEFLALKDYDL